MPTTIIAADTIQAALAEALQRIDRLEAAVTARDEQVAEQFAEQTILIGELREQDRVQAAAFKAAQTQLPATIRAIAGTGDSGQRRGDDRRGGAQSRPERGDDDGTPPKPRFGGNPDRGQGDARGQRGNARGGNGGSGSKGQDGRDGNGRGLRAVDTKKVAPDEPAQQRKRAHVWT